MNTKSVYIHIPFCDHICGYCSFTKFKYNRYISDDFIIRLISQINELPYDLETIYVGGGTPTSLHTDQLEGILRALAPHLAKGGEFTFEANPDNLIREKALILKQYGVNRMSLGVQTTDDDLLNKIGRHHKFYDVQEAIEMLQDIGMDNVSLDLIYGLPGQTLESFEKSMQDIIDLDPPHISIYALTVDPGTAFEKAGIKQVSVDLETEMYLRCIDMMKSNGYEHYEISNFAKKNYQSRHNKVYWHYENYYALGPGSSMKIDNVRKTWTSNMRRYLRGDTFDEILHLSKDESMFEFVMMGLRLKEGISFKRFYDVFGVDFRKHYHEAIKKAQDLIILSDTHITASEEGFIMLDDILLEFMD